MGWRADGGLWLLVRGGGLYLSKGTGVSTAARLSSLLAVLFSENFLFFSFWYLLASFWVLLPLRG